MKYLCVIVLAAAACGSSGRHTPGGTGDAAADSVAHGDGAPGDAPGDSAVVHDAAHDAAPTIDAFPSVLDVRIDCHNTCVLTAHPAAINVSAGTSFQVNWINVGDTVCDVNKVDQFNHVPIIIGLEPGTSYHDAVRDWCGTQFTGTFEFEVRICDMPSYIPVNCGA